MFAVPGTFPVCSPHFRFFFSRCERAEPAALFEALLVRPSRRVFEAAEAARGEVAFFGALRWDRALPAAVFDFFPVALPRRFFDAADAAFLPVAFLGIQVLLPVNG